MNVEIMTWMLKTEFKDWLQTVSIVIATIAAIASWRSVKITSKQFKLNEQQKNLKIKPLLRIRKIERLTKGFMLDLESLGHPFYYVKRISFSEDALEIEKQFNGEIGKDRASAKNSFVVVIKYKEDINVKGYFTFQVIDVEGNLHILETPNFIIEKGKIKNGIEIHKKYLM